MTLFRSPRTAVHFVTVLEEMPVQETADGIEQLRKAGLPVGGVIVNMVRPRDLDEADLDAARERRLDRKAIKADLRAAGVEVDDECPHTPGERRGGETQSHGRLADTPLE